MSSRQAALAGLLLAACHCETAAAPPSLVQGTFSAEAPKATAHEAPVVAETPPGPAVVALVPVSDSGNVSAGTVALARVGARTLAFVADIDDRAIVTFDVETRAPIASTPLGARPSAVLVTKQGLLAALGADDARVHLLAMVDPGAPLVTERTIDVPDEPVSASTSPAGDALLVASRWGHALAIVPLTSRAAPAVVDLPRDPAAVVPTQDGRSVVVMHAVGSRFSVVDLVTKAVRTASLDTVITRPVFSEEMMMPMPPQMAEAAPPLMNEPNEPPGQAQQAMKSPAPRVFHPRTERVALHADQAFTLARTTDGRLLAPQVFAETGPAMPTGGYGGSASSTVNPAVVSLSSADGDVGAPGGGQVFGSRCLLPRGATLADEGKRLLVVCAGSDELVDLSVKPKAIRVHRILHMPRGPSGIAFDPASRQAVVWSAFERVVTVVSFEREPKVASRTPVPRNADPPPAEALRGRELFHATFDARISSDGRACASCHPDGRDDGLTWSAPGGARQTPMLFARLDGTAPFGWEGDAKDLAHHLAHTTARLGGSGLSAQNVADIGAYLRWLQPPVPTDRASTTEAQALAARGRDLFHSADAECSSCHAGGSSSDADVHDVASRAKGDRARAFDTPSLRFVARSAPYFHDGRYGSLGDLVAGVDGTMGHTAQLSVDDRAALVAYLGTL